MLTEPGTTGDSSGNISFGFTREGAILFPEVEINYDVSGIKVYDARKCLQAFRCTLQR